MKGSFRNAVALRYRSSEDAAPLVSVKGESLRADELVKIAERYQIPVVENSHLAGALSALEIDEQIPESLFEAVAIVLSQLESP